MRRTLAIVVALGVGGAATPSGAAPGDPAVPVDDVQDAGVGEDSAAGDPDAVDGDPGASSDGDPGESSGPDAGEGEAPASARRRYSWGGVEIEPEGASGTESSGTGAGTGTGGESGTGTGMGTGTEPPSAAVGGYLHPTETKELAPKDGERKILIGSILLPLGTLATVTGAVSVWLMHPDHCRDRLGKFGSNLDPKQCRGLWILNIVRTSYGSLMIATGAALLGIGLHERNRYRAWKRQHGAYLQPWFGRGEGGLVFGGRF